MSPALFGPHHQAKCDKCGHAWKIAAETLRPGTNLVPCPVCDSNCSVASLLSPGQTVQAKKLPQGASLQRFDVVVFPTASDVSLYQTAWACKRIWGLPGELIELRGGDLIIDGKLFQKTPEQLLQLAIPLAHYPGMLQVTGGNAAPTPFNLATNPKTLDNSSPLELATGTSIFWNQPVVDDYPEDASTPRNLVPVEDLMMDIEFENHRDSESPRCLVVEFAYRETRHEVHCFFGRIDSNSPPSLPSNANGSRNSCFNVSRIYCGGWDGKQQFWINQEIDGMPTAAMQESAQTVQASRNDDLRFGLTVLNGPVHIKRLSVYRDIYLRVDERDESNGPSESVQLRADEFFVMGDNLPISKDSRNGLGVVRRKLVLGVVE